MIDTIIQDPTLTTRRMQQCWNHPLDLVSFNESVRDCTDLESGVYREQGTYMDDRSRDSDTHLPVVLSLDDMTTTTRRHAFEKSLDVVPFSPKVDALMDNPMTLCWKGNRPRAYAHDFSSPTSVVVDPCVVDVGTGEQVNSITLRRLVNFFPSDEARQELPWIPVVVAMTSTCDGDVLQREASQQRQTNDRIMSRLEEGLSFVDQDHSEPEPTAEDSTFSTTLDQLVLMWQLVRNGNQCRTGSSCEVYPGSRLDHSDFAFHISV